MKACQDVCETAAIALKLSRSSIRCVEDVWSAENVDIIIRPPPQIMNRKVLEEIVIRSFDKYLKRPGHVLLPDGMIPEAEFEKERNNTLLRVRRFWEYWHGSQTLNIDETRAVSTVQNCFSP